MFERDYEPTRDTVLHDRAYEAMAAAPDLSDEMEEVIRGEMTLESFNKLTSRQRVGLEGFKLDRDIGSIVPIIYSDYIAVACDSSRKMVTCNDDLVDKLLAIANTEDGWIKISTSPLTHCTMMTPSLGTELFPQLIASIEYSVKALPDIAKAYSEISSDGDKWNAIERFGFFDEAMAKQKTLTSTVSSSLDNYNNMSTIGETFDQAQFVEMLTVFKDTASKYVQVQDAYNLSILTNTANIIYRGYMIIELASTEQVNMTELVPKLTQAAKYVEECSQLVGYAGMLSGRINEVLGHINKAIN